MSKSEEIEAKLDLLIEQGNWVVAALKHLLQVEAGVEQPVDDDDDWLDDDLSAVDTSQFEHVAVRSRPEPKPVACRHRQQAIIGGILQCAECHYVFTGTGLRGQDATSPVPAAGQENQFNHGTRV